MITYHQEYYQKNKERLLVNAHRYYQSHKEQECQRSKKYYVDNRERILKRSKENRIKVLEAVNLLKEKLLGD